MDYITQKNSNGSIDIFDKRGFTEYTVDKNENGVIADIANKLNEYETFFEERLKDVLMDYFDIGNDTYAYNLTRVKSAFDVGTMELNDFEEFNEETVDDIVAYIKNNV